MARRFGDWLGTCGPHWTDPPDEQAAALDLTVQLGLGWVRVDTPWPALLDAAALDQLEVLVRRCAQRQLRVLGLVSYSPPEARPPSAPLASPPWHQAPSVDGVEVHLPRAADALGRLAAAGVVAWEGWNEYNARAFCQPAPRLAAPAIARFHAVLHDLLTARNLGPLVLGGTAPDPYRADVALADQLANGATFDHVGHHPYAFGYDPRAPEHLEQPYNALLRQPELVRDVLRWCARPDALIWATELGWPDSMGPDLQRARVTADLRLWLGRVRAGWAGPAMIYTARSDRFTTADGERFGLRDSTGAPKPQLCEPIAAAASWRPWRRPPA